MQRVTWKSFIDKEKFLWIVAIYDVQSACLNSCSNEIQAYLQIAITWREIRCALGILGEKEVAGERLNVGSHAIVPATPPPDNSNSRHFCASMRLF